MLSVQTESLLAQLFNEIAEGEKRVESVRQTLAQILDFDPYSAFNRIDRFQSGYISISDLQDFLSSNKVYPSDTELRMLFLSWDSDQDGRLSFTDFIEAVLPAVNRFLRT
jgi:Ca2+-binding EF-hand superfamily protein